MRRDPVFGGIFPGQGPGYEVNLLHQEHCSIILYKYLNFYHLSF
ncbi:MAG: hypothetical protein ACTSP4_15110 [Candidatus Hodarchaeales archaeon]